MSVVIEMGRTMAGEAMGLDLEELLATRLLVQGNSGSGKSHLLRRLLEQSAPAVQQAVLDPEGDFVTLAEVHGHVVIAAADFTEAALRQAAGRVRRHRVSVVVNLEALDAEQQMRAAAAFLTGLFEVDRDAWYPMLVVVDEAQLFAPSAAGEVADDARRLSLGAMTDLMARGRKRGLAGIIATQRLAKLAKNVAAEASNFLMGRTFLDIDMARAADLLGMERRQAEMFRDLPRGSFVALGPALSRRPVAVRIGPVETATRGGGPALLPLPETPNEAARALVLTAAPESLAPPTPLRRRPAALRSGESVPLPPPPAPGGASPLLDELLAQCLAEPEAPYRPLALLYQDFLGRARALGVRGEGVDLVSFRRHLAQFRAGLAESPGWAAAIATAETLPEEMQGVYLMIARAALTGGASPGDGEIGRIYGTSSPARVRRVIEWMRERGLVTVTTGRDGSRRITVRTIDSDA